MSDDILDLATQLEELLPDALRTLFVSTPGDPFADLPVGQIRVLRLLSKHGHSPGDLAAALNVTPPAIAQVLAKLEHHGLVQSENLERDRRCKLYSLSPLAQAQMDERRDARARRAAVILATMPPEQRQALVAALQNLTQIKLQTEPSND